MKTGNLLLGRYEENLIKGRSLESVWNVLKHHNIMYAGDIELYNFDSICMKYILGNLGI